MILEIFPRLVGSSLFLAGFDSPEFNSDLADVFHCFFDCLRDNATEIFVCGSILVMTVYLFMINTTWNYASGRTRICQLAREDMESVGWFKTFRGD